MPEESTAPAAAEPESKTGSAKGDPLVENHLSELLLVELAAERGHAAVDR